MSCPYPGVHLWCHHQCNRKEHSVYYYRLLTKGMSPVSLNYTQQPISGTPGNEHEAKIPLFIPQETSWLGPSVNDCRKEEINTSPLEAGGLLGGTKEPVCQCRRHKRSGSTPGLGRSPGGGHGNPLQYSCLENYMDRETSRATVRGVAKSQTNWSDLARTLSGG